MEIRRAIKKLGKGGYVPGSSATQGYTYNPIPFPGCKDIPCHRPNSHERWAIIQKRTEFEGKRVLDYGCATGYFSFMASQAGATSVTGVDHDRAAICVCREIARHYKIDGAAFFHVDEFALKGEYDVAFALSVLNWLGQEKADGLCAWLATGTKEVWAEIPLKGDGRGGARWLASDGAAAGWLLRHFSSVVACGETRGPHKGKMRTLFRCT